MVVKTTSLSAPARSPPPATRTKNTALGAGAGYSTLRLRQPLSWRQCRLQRHRLERLFVNNILEESSLANDKAYSLLYGVFSGAAGSLTGQQLTINGNVGINTTTPTAALTVQGQATTSTPGSTTTAGAWVCPTGLFSVTVELWGGGGGGGGSGATNGYAGGGGAGGAYAGAAVTVVPGNTYYLTAGTGGTAGTSTTNGSAGNPSCFSTATNCGGTVYVEATGGAYGSVGPNGAKGTGSSTGAVGTTVYAGGNGGTAVDGTISGAGGGGAGTGGVGGAASGGTHGTGTATGGGTGAAGSAPPTAPAAPARPTAAAVQAATATEQQSRRHGRRGRGLPLVDGGHPLQHPDPSKFFGQFGCDGGRPRPHRHRHDNPGRQPGR